MHVLVTRRLTLRPPTALDAEDIALGLSSWNVVRMLARVPHPYHPEDAEEWLTNLSGRPEDLVYTIHRERLIGVVSIEARRDGPSLGYWLGERWHGHGYMTEAAQALLEYAFASGDYQAVRSSVFIDNPASLRVQEKLGFVVNGTDEAWSLSRAARVRKWTTSLSAVAFGGSLESLEKSAA